MLTVFFYFANVLCYNFENFNEKHFGKKQQQNNIMLINLNNHPSLYYQLTSKLFATHLDVRNHVNN